MAGLGLHGRCWTEPAGAIYRNRIQIRYYPSLKWVKKGAGRRKKVEGARPEPLECQNVTPCQAATHWGPPRRICNSEVPTPQEDWNTRTISVAFSPIVQLAGGYLLPSQGENGNDMRKSRTDPFLTPFLKSLRQEFTSYLGKRRPISRWAAPLQPAGRSWIIRYTKVPKPVANV